MARQRPRRLTTTRDPRPMCPGCNRPMLLMSQPDPEDPGHILGCCLYEHCHQWTIFAQVEERWIVANRFFYPPESVAPASAAAVS